MSDELLQLVHHVIVDHVTLVLFHLLGLAIVNAEQVIAEGGNHEELLHHAVHVADADQVAQADVLLRRVWRIGRRRVAPRVGFLDGDDEGQELSIDELLHQSSAVLDQLV